VWHLRHNRKNRLDWANQNAVYTNPKPKHGFLGGGDGSMSLAPLYNQISVGCHKTNLGSGREFLNNSVSHSPSFSLPHPNRCQQKAKLIIYSFRKSFLLRSIGEKSRTGDQQIAFRLIFFRYHGGRQSQRATTTPDGLTSVNFHASNCVTLPRFSLPKTTSEEKYEEKLLHELN
jgi:hypothetical protein